LPLDNQRGNRVRLHSERARTADRVNQCRNHDVPCSLRARPDAIAGVSPTHQANFTRLVLVGPDHDKMPRGDNREAMAFEHAEYAGDHCVPGWASLGFIIHNPTAHAHGMNSNTITG